LKKQLIHIEQLSLGYNKTQAVLKDVHLNVEENDLILVIGENGAGKSTLLKSICGLIKPLSGEIKLKGERLIEWDRRLLAKELSYVSSNNSVNHLMTVKEFIAFGRYPYSNWWAKQKEEDIRIISEAITQCGLDHLQKQQINEISDGEKQKVFIARALAQKSDIFILDEPTTHLDIKNSKGIFKILKQQKQEQQKTIIFSSHQVEKALKIADKVWIVADGKVIEKTVEEFSSNKALWELVFGEEY